MPTLPKAILCFLTENEASRTRPAALGFTEVSSGQASARSDRIINGELDAFELIKQIRSAVRFARAANLEVAEEGSQQLRSPRAADSRVYF